MHGEAAPCDIAGSRIVILPFLHEAPCRFTVHTPRPTAESPDLSDFRGSHSRFCHLCTLHCADSSFKLSPQTHFAISAGFNVQVPSKFTIHTPRPTTESPDLGDCGGSHSRFCHLCTLHRADFRFQISDSGLSSSTPEARHWRLQISPCSFTLHGFGTGEGAEPD